MEIRKVPVAILTSEKIDIKTKFIKEGKEGHNAMLKGLI